MKYFVYLSMKALVVLLFVPVVFSMSIPEPIEICYEETVLEIEPKPVRISSPTTADLVNALIFVESSGNDSAVGDRHLVGNEAVGALQIRPIMVREVNRILKLQKTDKRFTLKDRFDRTKTIEMFLIWKNYHHNDSDFETIARNWNGGPKGFTKNRTKKYWEKVEKELNKGYDDIIQS